MEEREPEGRTEPVPPEETAAPIEETLDVQADSTRQPSASEEPERTETPEAPTPVTVVEAAAFGGDETEPAPAEALVADEAVADIPEAPVESEAAAEPTESGEAAAEEEAAAAPTPTGPALAARSLREGKLPQQGEVPAEGTTGPAWYVIHCYSGYENKVRHNLEQRIETMGMKDKIFDVVIPTQEEIEVREGKRRTVERHIFPGYVLVNMSLSEESWYVVRNTPGVTGFVGMGNLPTPLRPEEVAQIVKRMEAEAPAIKVSFKVGERVRIVDGPFNDFRGTVAEIFPEHTKVRVMVSFFGRETPVELDFLQVERA